MRIDPKGMIGGCPALAVRKALRSLRMWHQWGVADLEAAAPLAPGTGRSLLKALQTEGLIEASKTGAWTITQAGRTFSSATAAKPVTRATAEKALARFLDRVTQVNRNPYFLAKVTRVVLFGSMLKPEVERLSDVDLAVGLAAKEVDFELARERNLQRAEELANQGRRFRNFLEWEACWYWEAFRYLKRAESCDILGRLRDGEGFRAGGSASIPHWRTGTVGADAGYAPARGPEAAAERLPVLTEGLAALLVSGSNDDQSASRPQSLDGVARAICTVRALCVQVDYGRTRASSITAFQRLASLADQASDRVSATWWWSAESNSVRRFVRPLMGRSGSFHCRGKDVAQIVHRPETRVLQR